MCSSQEWSRAGLVIHIRHKPPFLDDNDDDDDVDVDVDVDHKHVYSVPRMEPPALVSHISHKPPFPGDGDRPPWSLMHLLHTTLMEEMMASNRFYSF